MKLNINWKLFLILFVTSIIASVLVLPYALALSPALASVFTPVVLIAQLIQSIILFAIAILVGLTLYKRVGFKIPILEGWLEGKEVGNYFKSILGISVELGVLAGVLIILFSFIFTSASSILQGAELTVPVWKSFLASFYGGIGEEILFRLFVMTVIVWIFYKIKKTPEGKPTTVGIWLAIIITAILFGVGHLPITGSITAITPPGNCQSHSTERNWCNNIWLALLEKRIGISHDQSLLCRYSVACHVPPDTFFINLVKFSAI
ncbi:CPBP family glutamic-type intramembrane protease [Methanobacterium sp.]|jgi:membrane protease YdiL (CAAX protease family)|uniref:CPBP family glutamic-type intramembrane protease n=1 Tax=Methanobacterium sp. TaxID=2164 RepID=UPI002583F8A5|nr:CPBP family glutamic-type intramembrane protease [Methanobacterium sp.]